MYPEVRIELARKKMTVQELSEKTKIKYQTLTAKLRGDSDITLDEAATIKRGLDCKLPLEVLFRKDGT